MGGLARRVVPAPAQDEQHGPTKDKSAAKYGRYKEGTIGPTGDRKLRRCWRHGAGGCRRYRWKRDRRFRRHRRCRRSCPFQCRRCFRFRYRRGCRFHCRRCFRFGCLRPCPFGCLRPFLFRCPRPFRFRCPRPFPFPCLRPFPFSCLRPFPFSCLRPFPFPCPRPFRSRCLRPCRFRRRCCRRPCGRGDHQADRGEQDDAGELDRKLGTHGKHLILGCSAGAPAETGTPPVDQG
jgi:hypothetical protein